MRTAIAIAVGCVLQIYGTLRYIRRLPDDTFGVILYITTCFLFGVMATVCYFRLVKAKEDQGLNCIQQPLSDYTRDTAYIIKPDKMASVY